MKRNSLLGFLLVGLVLMEWGCLDSACGDDGPYPAELAGVRSQWKYTQTWYNVDSLLVDTLNSHEVGLMALPVAARISSAKPKFNFVAYADDCTPAYPQLKHRISKVRIVDADFGLDWTDSFVYNERYYEDSLEINSDIFLAAYNSSGYYEDFGDGMFNFKSAVSEKRKYQFTIILEDEIGNVFETTTQPIIITL